MEITRVETRFLSPIFPSRYIYTYILIIFPWNSSTGKGKTSRDLMIYFSRRRANDPCSRGSMVHIGETCFSRSFKTACTHRALHHDALGGSRTRALFRTVASHRCKLIYQRVQGEQVVLRSSVAGNLLNRDEFIFERRSARPCSCTREHRFRSLTPFAPRTSSNSIPRSSFLRTSSVRWVALRPRPLHNGRAHPCCKLE